MGEREEREGRKRGKGEDEGVNEKGKIYEGSNANFIINFIKIIKKKIFFY